MPQIHADGSILSHPFEASGLGSPPYSYLGYEDTTQVVYLGTQAQRVPVGNCDFCGACIATKFFFRSSNGKKFGVGCDCFEKSCDDKNLVVKIASDKRKIERQKRLDRDERRVQELRPQYDSVLERLKTLPHPNSYYASQGKTAADYFEYVMKACSKQIAAKHMKAAILLANHGAASCSA